MVTAVGMIPEIEHTPPSEWCPHPEHWHAADGWATEDEVSALIAALVVATQPELVVETGSYTGATTMAIGMALARNGHGRVDSLEIDPARADRASRVCAELPVTVICGDSAGYTPDGPVGLLFLDGWPHTRADDMDRLWPHLAPGGLVAIHDTAPHHEADTDRLTAGKAAIHLRTPRGLLIVQKEDDR